MNTDPFSPYPPFESEVAAASRTLMPVRADNGTLFDRLSAASRLIASLPAPPAVPSLVFSRGGDAPVESVAIGEGITVGRGADAAINLEELAMLSRRHFSVRPQAGLWLLEDSGSRNGTKLDGVEGRITCRALCDGDIIFAGSMMFVFVNPLDG